MEFLTFVLDGQEEGVQVLYKDETIWATVSTDARPPMFLIVAFCLTCNRRNVMCKYPLLTDLE